MKTKLITLLNTLNTIETRGESTKKMTICLQYLERLIADVGAEEKASQKEAKDEVVK